MFEIASAQNNMLPPADGAYTHMDSPCGGYIRTWTLPVGVGGRFGAAGEYH